MTSLQHFIDDKGQEIEENLAQISELQKQLNDLQQQVRVQQQLHQAQKTSEVEVSQTLNQLKKLFKDLCGIYPVSAIDNLVEEIQEIAEQVKESYDEYADSGRFLQGVEESETEAQSSLTDASDLPLIAEALLPDEDDDETILSPSQVSTIITHKPDTHNFLKQQLGISRKVKRLSVLASKIAEHQLTRKRLEQFLKAAELTSSVRTLSLNGSSNGHG